MKKYILILAIFAVGCDAPVIEGHGFWAGQGGDETFIAGPSETTDVYNKFMDSHSERDMETIKSLLSEDLVIWHSDGSRVEGRDVHLEALQSWFDQTNPTFNPFWGMPYVGVNNAETWMIAAHNSKTTVDGEDSYASHMLDLQVTDGLVSMIIVYSRDLPPPPAPPVPPAPED